MNGNLTNRGNLQVSVVESSKQLPVGNASVRITSGTDGSVIEELKTDVSGQTPVIDLPAPPLEYSMQAEYETRPYSTYSITVSAPDFETYHISGVQILPQSTALQPAYIKAASASGFNVRNVLILPHTLWGDYPAKIPEDEVKELPKGEGFVILPEPVVPEFVVVHLGQPSDSSAENVWIYFKDYIKNVASSEIYSTWSKETIKANVLAILSFTMNRIYTEWYRSKGYNFTVTNSTQFDQSFVNGRNIFSEISNVVDELFTMYVTRENISQPLFTQYCDGIKVQCRGLSQWGSKSMGDEGYDAVSILKSYYGSDIYLANAERVEGVPLSWQGETLMNGSSGAPVEMIQKQLNRISDNYSAINKVNVNGYYGDETERAVVKFQEIFNMPVTGTVDFATWYRISNIFTGVSKLT